MIQSRREQFSKQINIPRSFWTDFCLSLCFEFQIHVNWLANFTFFLFERGNFFKERKNERTLVFHLREKGKRGDKANRVKQKTTKAKHGLVKKRNRREPEKENSSSTNIPRNSPNYPTHRKRHETKEQQSRARKK